MEAKKEVLVLGAGYVSHPLIEYLSREVNNYNITVASDIKEQLEAVTKRFPIVHTTILNVTTETEKLSNLIGNSKLVVSLLPPPFHKQIGKECVKQKVSMVTASYCSPDIASLNEGAINAGITLLNEVGLDPGIDHLLALDCFNQIRSSGGIVESYKSFCGGLPAPQFANNPLKYKFSWNPIGVLVNCLRSAKYKENDKVVEIEAKDLMHSGKLMDFFPSTLEMFANRDSLTYEDLYQLHDASSILRGTLRYEGFATTIIALIKLNFLKMEKFPFLASSAPELKWRQLLCLLINLNDTTKEEDLRKALNCLIGEKEFDSIMELGLLSDDLVEKKETPIDTLSHYLTNYLAFHEEEIDVVILRHEIIGKWGKEKREKKEISLILYGDPNGFSAMAQTVGYTAGIAAKMVLEGEIKEKGIVFPFASSIYTPMLQRLKDEGISAKEETFILE